jgi:hypothetical protein
VFSPCDRLSRALAAIGPRPPRDLGDLVAQRPPVGALPLPWSSWTLILLVDYGARKRWAYDMIRSRVAPHLARRWGGDVALEDLQERWFVPGLPEWECELDGMYSWLINRISREQIHVDLVHGPGVFSSCQLSGHFRSQRHPGPDVRRLLELCPSCWALRLVAEELIDAGMIHPVDEFDFELCAAARALEGPIAAFLDTWQDHDRRPWLAALIGDWPAAHAAARAVGDPGLVALIGDRPRECREQWLDSIRDRIAEEGLDDDSLHALAEAGARTCRSTCIGPSTGRIRSPSRLRQAGPAIPSHQDATARDSKRPQPATQNATRSAPPDDPGLALIVERWDSLPEAVRAAIVAMVRASGVPPK